MATSRTVTQALLHGPLFVPGVGQLRQQLDITIDRSGKIKTMTMELSDSGYLDVTVNGVSIGIPLANIQAMTFKNAK